MRNSTKNRKKIAFGLALLSPLAILGGLGLSQSGLTSADSTYYVDYRETVEVTNGSFTQGASPYASGNLTGWTLTNTESKAKGMIIDVGQTFSQYQQNTYLLDENPGKAGSDNKILMINSKENSEDEGGYTRKGYTSSSITLSANSYYRFSIDAKTALNGSSAVATHGSIYISGLVDEDGEEVSCSQENFENTTWQTYYFYLATGEEEQEITIDLYLGSKTTPTDGGVVFFDDVILEQYSQNTFYRVMSQTQNSTVANENSIYLLDQLQSSSAQLDMSSYNFDFENVITDDNYSTLGDEWEALTTGTNAQYGNAFILPVSRYTQASQFRDLTGENYAFAGNTLSYNSETGKENTQALVLYSDTNRTTVYGVESKDIEIKAHGLYRFSVYVKVSNMSTGNFYITVKENDTIYETYSFDEDFLSTASATSEAISSTSGTAFNNNYQRIDFYVKGHEFYDSSVNLQFWLGNEETPATGCVFIDDITLSYVDYSEYDAGTNKLELKSFTESPTFTNAFFNQTENEDNSLTYPLKASGWTLEQNSNSHVVQEAGVVYLHNKEKYEKMYTGYAWQGIYPGSPDKIDAPNNVYMFYNQNSTYQNLTSSSYTLEANNYYKLTFDYFTSSQSAIDASLTIEVIDENNITLFKQSGFSSENSWGKAEIYFHTAEQSSNNIQVKVHFGENEDGKLMQGIAYIDNFEVISDISEEKFNSANYQVDLTDYLLNLDPTESIGADISNSTAYTFSVDESVGNASNSQGGIVRGQDNAYTADYGIEVEDSNILVLSNFAKSKSTITSNYTLNLTSGSYYKLTFDLRTIFPNGTDKEEFTTDEHDCSFGVSVGLSNFDLIEKLFSEDEFTTYTIYFYASEDSTPNLQLQLLSDCDNTTGSAFLTHISFTSSTEEEYNSASSSSDFENTVFTASATESDDATDDDETTDDSTDANPDNSVWLLIPSIIFGVAIIFAVLVFALRKINIKKVEKIREESYNRKVSLNYDLIMREAQRRRDEEVKTLKDTVAELEKQKQEIEISHKEEIKQARLNSKGKITKETERAFKTYTSSINRIQQKIEILQEQITSALKPEHLLDIERKVTMEEEKRLKNERKQVQINEKDKKDLSKEDKKK